MKNRIYTSFTGLRRYLFPLTGERTLTLEQVENDQNVLFAFGCARSHVLGKEIYCSVRWGDLNSDKGTLGEWVIMFRDQYGWSEDEIRMTCERFQLALEKAEAQGRVFWQRDYGNDDEAAWVALKKLLDQRGIKNNAHERQYGWFHFGHPLKLEDTEILSS